jgi:hypothetical protein
VHTKIPPPLDLITESAYKGGESRAFHIVAMENSTVPTTHTSLFMLAALKVMNSGNKEAPNEDMSIPQQISTFSIF